MDTAPLKSFATRARTDLIAEVSAGIRRVLAPASPERVEQPGAVAALEKAISAAGGGEVGRAAVADKVAYTWFNRIIALRFMDANGYTGIGVVSPARGQQGGQPEILADAKRGTIDTTVVTNKSTVEAITGLLDGTRRSEDPQGEAYALLLAEYCRHWNRAMPFMFEREGDYTELLIPANLLADDSVLARAVATLTEDACQDVEVIGWLYQFYISERKDEVFAGFKKNKKAGAAEIPAATQLFTPHWIVRYLVENSLGRLWLLNRPSSRLAEQMDYYIAPVDEETDFLKVTSPEELKIIDPACGSGHMLTYAFDLLYAIYQEEGYAPADIPSLILTRNLYGIEIDPRAGALAAFALTMKARARQRTFFTKQVKPNVCVLEPITFTPPEMDLLVTPDGDRTAEAAFWNAFEHANMFGSLICSREGCLEPFRGILEVGPRADGDILAGDVLLRARRVIEQFEYLSRRYHVLVANPPYMSSRNMSEKLAEMARLNFVSKGDLFAMFIERALALVLRGGSIAMVTMQAWMFLTGYLELRKRILSEAPIRTLAHLGSGAFSSIGGEVVSTTAFVLTGVPFVGAGVYLRLVDAQPDTTKDEILRKVASGEQSDLRFVTPASAMRLIPESPIAYWLDADQLKAFASGVLVRNVARATKGIDTGNNARFLRRWYEVSASRNSVLSGNTLAKWIPYNKGGGSRRWYGHREYVLNWEDDGREVRAAQGNETAKARVSNEDLFFTEGFTWSTVSPGSFGIRWTPPDSAFDNGGSTLFTTPRRRLLELGGLLNTRFVGGILKFLAPTINTQPGEIGRVPVPRLLPDTSARVIDCIELAREDWNSREETMGFGGHPTLSLNGPLRQRVQAAISLAERRRSAIEANEMTLEREYRDAFGLDPDRAPCDIRPATVWDQSTTTVMRDLASFAVGCMFGRYSLDEPGLILANQGDTLQEYSVRVPSPSFPPDKDNVLPVVDGDWFEDDIVARFRKFLRVAFGEEHFEENLRFVTESLGVKDLRDYFLRSFYKDHVQRYKKRPIYWLFSSPKGSFNALIYMHRYTPSTVSTVLNEYLREFKAKLEASRQHHERLAVGGGTPRQQAAALKEVDRLRKVLLELEEYEHDVLYPLATRQVAIDLDDGVKANYPKFGAALKKIPGLEASDE